MFIATSNEVAQTFVFCSQIVTEWINAEILLVSEFKMIRKLLNVVHC